MAKPAVTMKGNPVELAGGEVNVGDPAPEFQAVGTDLQPVGLSACAGKVVVICAVPSLDTPVCDTEIRRFNEEAKALGDGVAVVAISTDLPFAQARWCGAAGADAIVPVSDHRDVSFGRAYGVLLEDLRLLARAVFVIDAEGVVRHTQVVPEITAEPDYDAVLEAVKSLV